MVIFNSYFDISELPRQRDRWLDGTRLTERQLRNEQEQAASALVVEKDDGLYVMESIMAMVMMVVMGIDHV